MSRPDNAARSQDPRTARAPGQRHLHSVGSAGDPTADPDWTGATREYPQQGGAVTPVPQRPQHRLPGRPPSGPPGGSYPHGERGGYGYGEQPDTDPAYPPPAARSAAVVDVHDSPLAGFRIPPNLTRFPNLPWPHHPADLAPPSTDLLPEQPRRHDTDIDPAIRWASVDLRIQIARRMTEFNENHVSQAWKMRYRRPLSPTMTALLFAVPVGREPLRYTLRTDARIWHEHRDVADPAAVLQRHAHLVYDGWRDTPGFDPRTRLTNQPDEHWRSQDWSPWPEFAGVALSTLDTEYGPWKRVQRDAAQYRDVPTEVLIQLVDGGRIKIVRHGDRKYHTTERLSSVSLNTLEGGPVVSWDPAPELNTIRRSDRHVYTWHFLAELTRMIYWGWGWRR